MKYVIIGNSAAAVGAVEGIRSRDEDSEIVIISQENHHTYSRPLISYLLAGKINEKQMYYRSSDFYSCNKVKALLGEKVVAIAPERHIVHITSPGMDVSYDRLLLAAGGTPVIPACFHECYDNLFHFHSWDDAVQIKARLQADEEPLRCVIVGGGLIGLKAAEALTLCGQKVTVVEAAGFLLNSVLDKEGAAVVKNHLEAQGINIILSAPVSRVEGEGNIESLVLEDGTRVECDLVVLAAGVKPNWEWCEDIGLNVDRGVLVNEELKTSLPDIYAAGDIAQVYEENSGMYRSIPILPVAYRQGKTAGLNMTGEAIKYDKLLPFNSIPILGLNIATAGSNPSDDGNLEIMQKNGKDEYRRVTLKNNRLIGFIMIGNISRSGLYSGLIEKKVDTESFKSKLLKDDFGVMDIPDYYNFSPEQGGLSCKG